MIYLYGFVDSAAEGPAGELGGIDGQAVSLLDMEGLVAVVSRVSDESYSQAAVELRSKDLTWLAERGASHERIVTWFVDRGDVVPVPLMTLYSSEDQLRKDALDRKQRVLGTFARLGGRREWDLKVSYDARRLEENLGDFSQEVAELDRQLSEASPGRRYLLQRKRDELVRSAVGETARRLASGIMDTLADVAEDTVRLPLPREAADLPVILRGAFLVRREDEARLLERLADRMKGLEDAGIRAELSGPWAPYRFVEGDNGG